MFTKLTNFEYQRTITQAILFYIIYFVIGFLICALMGAIIVYRIASPNFLEVGLVSGNVCAIAFSAFLSFLVSDRKKLLKDFKAKLLIFSSAILALILGLMLGLIPAAYLTTISSESKNFSGYKLLMGIIAIIVVLLLAYEKYAPMFVPFDAYFNQNSHLKTDIKRWSEMNQ